MWILFILKDVSRRADIIAHYEITSGADGLPVVGHFSLVGGFDLHG